MTDEETNEKTLEMFDETIEECEDLLAEIKTFAPVLSRFTRTMWKKFRTKAATEKRVWDTRGWFIGRWRDMLQEKIDFLGECAKDSYLSVDRIGEVEYDVLLHIALLSCFGAFHCEDLGDMRDGEIKKAFEVSEKEEEWTGDVFKIIPTGGKYRRQVFYCVKGEDLATALQNVGASCRVETVQMSEEEYHKIVVASSHEVFES